MKNSDLPSRTVLLIVNGKLGAVGLAMSPVVLEPISEPEKLRFKLNLMESLALEPLKILEPLAPNLHVPSIVLGINGVHTLDAVPHVGMDKKPETETKILPNMEERTVLEVLLKLLPAVVVYALLIAHGMNGHHSPLVLPLAVQQQEPPLEALMLPRMEASHVKALILIPSCANSELVLSTASGHHGPLPLNVPNLVAEEN